MSFRTPASIVNEFNRLTMIMFGGYRVGKTTAALKLAEAGEKVYLFTVDRGIRAVARQPKKYKGNLFISTASTLDEMRDDTAQVRDHLRAKIAKGDGANMTKTWVVTDTITHLQTALLVEARTVEIKGTTEPTRQVNTQRDATTRADYNINLAWLTELTARFLEIPCNILFIALEKDGKNGLPTAMLSGQSHGRILGSCDIISRMVRDSETRDAQLICGYTDEEDTGSRDGELLDTVEPADLALLRDKYLQLGKFANKG